MRSLENNVKEIHSLARSTNDNQIKGKKQSTDLSKAGKFVYEVLDELEKENGKWKRKMI